MPSPTPRMHRHPGEIVSRMGRWLLWTLLMSLVPFAGVYLFLWLIRSPGPAPELDAVIGSGQLLLTSIGLTIGTIREVTNVPLISRSRSTDSLIGTAIVLLVLMLFSYAGLNSIVLTDGPLPADVQQAVTMTSIGALLATAGLGLVAVWVCTPPPWCDLRTAQPVGDP